MLKTFFCKMHQIIYSFIKKIPLHVVFFGCVWFFFYVFFSVGSENIQFIFWFSTILSAIAIVTSYMFIYYLVPKYLFNKKYWVFLLYTIYSGVFVLFSVLITVVFGFVFFFNLEFKTMPALTKNSSVILVCIVLIIVLSSSIKILLHNYKSIEEKNTIQNKLLKAQLQLKEQELKFLKMQIHPHFLFNSLNTIYGFALKKGDEAPDMILKLSNLLDYILYQIEKPVVLLAAEVNHLLDYVSLEKMRFHDTLEVVITEELPNKNIQIAPMLLIPFVENSFKHGVIINGKLTVDIRISLEGNTLHFLIVNSASSDKKEEFGIGLGNIKKRLQMLYPDAHQLKIEQTNTIFKVALTIETNGLKLLKNED